eukprot:11486.XXX_567098_570577_1 [CDS] Oithona nana genome sequencing.
MKIQTIQLLTFFCWLVSSVEASPTTLQENAANETDIDCGLWTEEMEHKVYTCCFWMEGLLLTGTGTVGLIGNFLSIVILSKPDMYNSFNQLLIALSTMDSVFIILAIIDYSFSRAFQWSSQVFTYLFPYLIYPLNSITFCASIFTTVALAFERHTAVCRPIHYRNVTATNSVRRRTLCYVVPVLLMALILNVPKFLEAQFTWTPIEANGTILNDSQVEYQIGYQTTELRDDPNYIQFYINWTRLITTGLIPMGALIYFNFGIFRGIQMTHERVKKKNKQRASEMNLAAILLCIVFLFLVCHFPRILLNVHEIFMLGDMMTCGNAFSPPVWYHCFVSFNHLLLIVNASCNFLIYVSVGDKFKTTIDNFCYSISGCKKRQGSPSSLAEKDNAFEGGEAEDENEKVAIPLVNVV